MELSDDPQDVTTRRVVDGKAIRLNFYSLQVDEYQRQKERE